MQEQRQLLTFYEPTARWLETRQPVKGQDILRWYEREKGILNRRLRGPVVRQLEFSIVEVDRETKKEVRRSKRPSIYEESAWRLSQEDYLIYLRLLNSRFQKMKEEHNQKVLAKRKKKDANRKD